jgi:hypothetical protein
MLQKLIKSDPAKKLQRDVDAARSRRNKLEARLTAAESHLSDSRSEPSKLARDGAPDAALDAAEEKVKAAEARVTTLRSAISDEDANVGELERRLAEIAHEVQKHATADQLDGWSVEVDETAKKVDVVIAGLADLADRVEHCVPEAAGVAIFAGSARSELALALQAISNELNGRARGVRAGTYAATLPNRPPPPAPPVPAPAVENVWVIKPIAFSQAGHGLRIVDLNEQVNLPPALAKKAIAAGAAVPVGDPRFGKQVASWRRWHGYGGPPLEQCVRLDDEAEAAASGEQPVPEQPRIVHHLLDPTFEPLDRGAPYVIKTHGPEAAA